ncbi:DUF6580 family putative transport protein [Flavihumibacter sp. CACIAM 22H1]|uniref:DUF6580 family putative transport protein n=1 Tax=Flavihumibacter sp. CACIAM 22H1 TaxID=1812911 RepID=UPI0007A90C7D|nr:DUF6580 family putative transport protein [Flavihumibacter sp. CACIAM 22H1]KYP14383.1 MAG: hypothetical protein A1D16_17750 [Flavihumibacter sp. CACIAM 22H1]
MSLPNKQPSFGFLLVIIAVTALLRIPIQATGSSLANFTPVGAMALFAGSYFKPWWKAYLFPLLILLIGDLLINTLVYEGKYGIMYKGWYWMYCIFIAITLIGQQFLEKRSATRIVSAGIGASLLFWMVADFIVWAGGGTDLRTMQPLSRNLDGLLQCYWQGFPFALNFMAGTLVYTSLLFGISYLLWKPGSTALPQHG